MSKTLAAIRRHRVAESNTVVKYSTLDSWTDGARERSLALDTQSNKNAVLAYQLDAGTNAKEYFGFWDNQAMSGWLDNKGYASIRDLFTLVKEGRLARFRAKREGTVGAPDDREMPTDRNTPPVFGEEENQGWTAPATVLKKGDEVEFIADDFRKGLKGIVTGPGIPGWWAIDMHSGRNPTEYAKPEEVKILSIAMESLTEAASVSIEELAPAEQAELVDYLTRQQIAFEQDHEKGRIRFDARDQEVIFDIIDEIQNRPTPQNEWKARAEGSGCSIVELSTDYRVAMREGAVVGDFDDETGEGSLLAVAETGETPDAEVASDTFTDMDSWATDAKATFPDGQFAETPLGAEWRTADGSDLLGEWDEENQFGWLMDPSHYAGESVNLKRLKWRRIVQQEGAFPADKMAPKKYKLLVYPPKVGHNQSDQWMALWRDLSPENVGVQGLGKDRESAIADLRSKRDLPNA